MRFTVLSAFASLAFWLSSCSTIQTDVVSQGAGEADFAQLDSLSDDIASLSVEADLERLRAAAIRAKELKTTAPLSPRYRSRLAALSGELALLAHDPQAAGRALSEARAQLATDEWVYLLQADLAPDAKRREAILKSGLGIADEDSLIKAALAELRYRAGDYIAAVSGFDEVFPALSPAWRQRYATDRDSAFSLRGTEGIPRDAAAHATADAVSLAGMVVIAQQTTALLDYLTGGRSWALGPLFDRLRSDDFFGPDMVKSGDAATRAQAAQFLWLLVAAKEGDGKLLRSYSDRYGGRADAKSPVPDLPMGAWFFDAALGCVEREILSLPDGIDFLPMSSISGADFWRAARKAAE